MTAGQENALRAAEDYIDLRGSRRRASSSNCRLRQAKGFSRADATFAANHIDVDWNAEAVRRRRDYLDLSAFSPKSGLIEQLSSSAGDQFTRAQAEYAADKVYGG